MSTAWGIDLGTTNSCISRTKDGVPEAIAIDGSPIVPSVVLFGDDGVRVGREARNLALTAPERAVRSVKRRMGRGPSYTIGARQVEPEEVSAEILKALARGAAHATGSAVEEVVITVPAYFDDAQRRATLRAGELAGLKVLRLLNEPTSASLVYEQARAERATAEPEIVMIYDLGGGTFDVSILEVFDGVREVRSTAGNTELGGDDFDELLFRRFVDHLKHDRGVDPSGDLRALARLRNLAERTKIELSSRLAFVADEEFIAADPSGAPVHFSLEVTRTELEAAVRPLLAQTIALARRALDDAKLTNQKLARICLVGGSTRIPLVGELLRDAFEVPLHQEISPDLAVALGAAIQAAILHGEPVDRILVDVAAHSLGIIAVQFDDDGPVERFATVLPRNTVLPSARRRPFRTIVEHQERIDVEVLQGESKRPEDNRRVGSFYFDLEPGLEAGTLIEVGFEYDLDGVVRVTVKQGEDNEKTVAMRLADAGAPEAETPVLRRARALLPSLDQDDRAELEALVARCVAAPAGERDGIEDEILDFLFELEADGDPDDGEEPEHGAR